MTQDYCITFAGPVGCSKSPVAHYISTTFGWPIFSNDAIRHEVLEDTLHKELDVELLEDRIAERSKLITQKPSSIIYDASQDRHWDRFYASFTKTPPYKFGVISFDLSPHFYKQLLEAKAYSATASTSRVRQVLEDHERFVEGHRDFIICSITDATFPDRLYVAEEAVRKFTSDKTDDIR